MKLQWKRLVLTLAIGAAAQAPVLAEDIDLFAGAKSGSTGSPNILFIIDNTANWSEAKQQWPDEPTQGQAELIALKDVLGTLDGSVNAGLMLFDRDSSGGGYVRRRILPMNETNKKDFQDELQKIYNNVTAPAEKVPAGKHYSGVLFDAFKYFGGGTGTPRNATTFGPDVYTAPDVNLADPHAYTNNFKTYVPPTSVGADCGRNYIVFIGNGFPDAKSQELKAKIDQYLAGVGGDTTQVPNVLPDNKQVYADEWTRFLYRADASTVEGQQNIITYTIDVFNAKPDANQNSLMTSMARVGGGKPFQAKSKKAIELALKEILIEIQATNSVFASAALPVSANSRAENDNLVFLGMFRPDPKANPRWFGNLKRYSLKDFGGYIELADQRGRAAINTQTGFFSDCSVSYWTEDSGNYWESADVDPLPKGTCTLTDFAAFDAYSDLPDGSFVEKGGVSRVLRSGNGSGDAKVHRTMYTTNGAGSSLVKIESAGLDNSKKLVDYVLGQDVLGEKKNDNVASTDARPSIHGDVVHSRLLPITYGGTSGTILYYGSNDGALRAVDAETGRERWSFVHRESFTRLARIKDNSPRVLFPTTEDLDLDPSPTPKDYFFDGPIGAYQAADASKTWIYPSMRRGGRMIYAFDVSNPDSPTLLWRNGCANLDNDTGCTTGFTSIGQTWSTPVVAFIKGYNAGSKPVIVVGGGYDRCEDADTAAPSCTGAKGASVFVLDAYSGAVLQRFTAAGMRPIPSDVSLVDLDFDGLVDYAYAADTGGNIWRINFVEPETNAPLTDTSSWKITRAAYTDGSGRKFLYGPALLPTKGKVYLALGSGDREHPLKTHYPFTNPVKNRFYVYLDDPTKAEAHDLDGTTTSVLDATAPTSCETEGVIPGGTKKSWFMNLDANGTGEQTVTSALIAGGMIAFSTNRPEVTTNSCSFSLGEARGYWVNLLNGSGTIGVPGSCGGQRSSIFVGGGLPPSPVRGVVRIDGHAHNIVISAAQRDGAVSSSVGGQKLVLPIKSRRNRIYWFQEGER
ncbi:MAG: hypothetical protein LT102_03425 [Burkholderiaceae bacterium]|nr:hypothetical protein [Burkholderiaceae bacterium]